MVLMFAWPVTARWVLHNGKFLLSIPYPMGHDLVSVSNVYTKIDDLHIEGNLKTTQEYQAYGDVIVQSRLYGKDLDTRKQSKMSDLRLSELR
jgi:hypothetical protein